MKKTRITLCAASAGAIVAISMALSGCNEAPARVEPPPPKVSVQHPEVRKLVDYDGYNGWLRASDRDQVDIRARVRGHLDKINFTDGDIVQKDQVLFELDPRPFEAEVGRANDEVKIFEAQHDAAEKELKRFKELVTKGGASQSQVDLSEAQTTALAAQIEGAKQEVKRRELDVEYAKIKAPLTGKIGRSMMSIGSLVNAGPGEDVLATVVSLDPIYVFFNIDERSLQRYMQSRVKPSETGAPTPLREKKIPIKFKLDTDTEYRHEGMLDFADNQVDATTGTILVRAVVKNDKGLFVSGSRVNIRVPVTDEHDVVVVPDTSILTDQSKKYLLVLDEKKVVQRRDVEMGKLLDDQMRVVRAKDLKADDWIITQGLQMARINYPVEPIMPAGAAPAAPATSQPAAAANAAQ